MKKILTFVFASLFLVSSAQAESIVVIDQNGTVVRQIFTSPATYNETVTTVPVQTVSVVRESPVIQNSYYYDRPTTNEAIAAGITTAVVGGLLFNGFRHHHHHHKHGGGSHHHKHHR